MTPSPLCIYSVCMGGYCEAGCDTSVGLCSVLITLASMVLIVATLPLSLMFTVKVAQVGLLCVTQPLSSGTVWVVMMYVSNPAWRVVGTWNNGKEVPRWGVAKIQKMSPSTTGRCYCCHYLSSYWSHEILADQSPSRNCIRRPGVVGKTILDVRTWSKE